MIRRHAQLEMDPVYGFFYGLCRLAHQMFFRGDVAGLENLPDDGGYIVAANHASLLDPPMVGQFLPRQIAFFARKTLWKPGIAAWWLTAVGTIPVDRDGGTSLDAIKRVLQDPGGRAGRHRFSRGHALGHGELQPPKAGVGLLACKARVPVVPARVFGSFEAFGRDGHMHFGSPVSVTYGKPLCARGLRSPGGREGALCPDGRAHHGGDRKDRAAPDRGRHLSAAQVIRVLPPCGHA
jgi:1-acyl-sn-glycerol-3-phosphate acyltransferase